MSERDTQSECNHCSELLARSLFTADLTPAEQSTLETHLAACEFCREKETRLRETQEILGETFESIKAPASLLPKVIARLPRAVPAESGPARPGALNIQASGSRGSKSWRLAFVSAIAAAVAVVVGLRWIQHETPSASVARGVIVDANGRAVTALVAGKSYTVKSEAVVPLHEGAKLRLTEGAQFAVQQAPGNALPGMQLERGDVYTVGSSARHATRVSMQTFDADLQQGDFFVSSDDSADPRGVLIVFDGLARVAQAEAPLDVPGGHVFVSVKSHADGFSEMLSMAEVLDRLQQDISIQGVRSASLREEYARKVAGYDQELKELAKAANGEADPLKKAELLERRERVQAYRAQHHKRLKTLRNEFPSDQIRRGLDRHLPPERWM